MSGKKSKLIRRIMALDKNNPILRRNYRRVKKAYTECPENHKTMALVAIAQKFSKQTQ